jgi:hypothetical protein
LNREQKVPPEKKENSRKVLKSPEKFKKILFLNPKKILYFLKIPEKFQIFLKESKKKKISKTIPENF